MKKLKKVFLLGGIALSLLGCAGTQSDYVTNLVDVVTFAPRCDNAAESMQNQEQMKDGIPIFRVAPKYPIKAVKSNTGGYVLMEFDISEEGEPVNINVTEASPSTLFVDSAVEALSAWRYNKEPRECLTLRLDYALVH